MKLYKTEEEIAAASNECMQKIAEILEEYSMQLNPVRIERFDGQYTSIKYKLAVEPIREAVERPEEEEQTEAN